MISILILGRMGNESGFGFRQTEKTQRAVAVVNVSGDATIAKLVDAYND